MGLHLEWGKKDGTGKGGKRGGRESDGVRKWGGKREKEDVRG